MIKSLDKKGFFFWLAVSIIVLGMGLRILMYVQNRSLFIDEACLSSQLIERTYGGLFENLEYQYAPPFFAIAEKAMVEILGPNEYALRLFPLLAALLGLVLFYRLCSKFLPDRYLIFPLFLFSFGMPLLQYATEVKQYSSDILVTILLLLLSFRWKVEDLNFRKAIWWALIGSFVVWFSMPGVFMLFGLGIFYLYEIYKKQLYDNAVYILVPIGLWLLSFGIYYFTIIRKDIGLENLEDYHGRFFLPLLPTNLEELTQFGEIIITFFRTAIGATILELSFGVLTFFLALYTFWKKDFSKVIIFTLPILAAMIASGLKLYSLIPRLTLFFMPILILLIGIGQERIFERISTKWKWLLIMPLLVIVFNQKGYQYFYNRFSLEEMRPVLYQVAEKRKEGDAAFLFVHGKHSYHFYANHYQDAERLKIPNIVIEEWDDQLENIEIPKGDRLWLVFSHAEKDEIAQYTAFFQKEYRTLNIFEAKSGAAVLLELKK